MSNSIIYKIKSSFIKLPITIAGIATLTFLGTLNIDSAPLTLGLMGIVLISVLIFLRTKSMRRSQMHRQKIKYSLLFIGISALFTILNNYLLLDLFEGSIIYKILIFVTMPLIFQMYYKLVLCIQYLTFKEPTQEIDNSLSENQLPGCSVLIATRNEPFDVCKLTFDSANQLHYPAHKKQIIVVDNSDLNHQDLEQWRNYVEKQNTLNPDTEYKFIHRNSTVGFKPKNLDIGMEYVNQPYVMLLDADSTLKADTLKRVMPEFIKDKKLGFASLLIKGTNDNSSLFAKIGCMSQNMLRYTMSLIGHRGFAIFQGHNSIWSKETLDEIGPWLEEHRGEPMIVEDVAAAVRCYFKGHYGKTVWVDSGEWVPTSLKECESMWMRWTYGNMQITHKYFWKIIFSKEITFKEKIDIINQMFSFSAILTPVFSFLGIFNPQSSILWLSYILLLNLPAILNMIGYGIRNKPHNLNRKEKLKWLSKLYLAFFVMSSFISWVSAKAVLNYLLRRPQGWKPTGKKAENNVNWLLVLKNYQGMLGFSLLGICIAVIIGASLKPSVILVVTLLLSSLFFINLLLNLVVFGSSSMREFDDVTVMSI